MRTVSQIPSAVAAPQSRFPKCTCGYSRLLPCTVHTGDLRQARGDRRDGWKGRGSLRNLRASARDAALPLKGGTEGVRPGSRMVGTYLELSIREANAVAVWLRFCRGSAGRYMTHRGDGKGRGLSTNGSHRQEKQGQKSTGRCANPASARRSDSWQGLRCAPRNLRTGKLNFE